jgi:hypothetical protein
MVADIIRELNWIRDCDQLFAIHHNIFIHKSTCLIQTM